MKLVVGDITKLDFDVIAHGCNCMCVQGAGIARTYSELYGTNNPELYPLEGRRDPNKLGMIQGNEFTPGFWVYNLYTQIYPGANAQLSMVVSTVEKLVDAHPGLNIGIPLIGAGIGGLKAEDVLKSLIHLPITVVLYG